MLRSLLGSLVAHPWRSLRARRAQALCRAGLEHQRAGDEARARRDFERALRLDPALYDCWIALGDVHYRAGAHDRAGACYRAALQAAPACAPALRKLGGVLRDSGRLDEAIMHLRRARELAPHGEGLLRDLVIALVERDNCQKALSVAKDVHARSPDWYEASLSLGIAFQKAHDPERALACYEAALAIRRDDAELFDFRGSTYMELGRLDAALREFDRALALRPGFALAAFHRALARLLLGDFDHGWGDYEQRRPGAGKQAAAAHEPPQWDGSALAGRTILVSREQGLGDEIMFASILPQLITMADHCIVECDPRLRAIFARSFPAATVFASIPHRGIPCRIAQRRIDAAIPAGSVARFLRRSAADFPRHDGYLKADPQRVQAWRQRLAALGPGVKIGLSWTGGVRETRRALRSVSLPQLRPILQTPGARFVSLQYTAGARDEAAAFAAVHAIQIEHWQEAIDDYDETAALVCALDLVVSVCTSLVHLGGALGRPVWVMAPYSPEWRYGLRGEAMPWYPSVRIFRQPAYAAWEPVIAAVAAELRRAAGERPAS